MGDGGCGRAWGGGARQLLEGKQLFDGLRTGSFETIWIPSYRKDHFSNAILTILAIYKGKTD